MKSEALRYFPHVELTCLALVLFFVSFVLILIYAFHKKNKDHFNALARLPLEGD